MKRIQLLTILLLPLLLSAQQKEQKTRSRKNAIFINWGTWSLGYQIGTAHADNLYGISKNSNFTQSRGLDVKFSDPIFFFKVENITKFIYWNMELALPFSKKITVQNETDPNLQSLTGKARFGRMINIPISLGTFVTKRLGFWCGYNFSLFYLQGSQANFTANNSGYIYIENFRAGDVGLLKGSGINFHTMIHVGSKNLFRFSVAGTSAGNKKFNVKGGALVTEFVYFIGFDKNNLSRGMMIRWENTKVTCEDHPFIARFGNEKTIARSNGLAIEFCFGIPETKHRSSNINMK